MARISWKFDGSGITELGGNKIEAEGKNEMCNYFAISASNVPDTLFSFLHPPHIEKNNHHVSS